MVYYIYKNRDLAVGIFLVILLVLVVLKSDI